MGGQVWDELKKPIYAVAKQDSDNMEGIGRAIGWDWLEQEAKTNQKNPGRAIGKAAGYAVGSMLGGWLGGAGGAAGSAAAEAGTAAGTTAAEVATEQAMMEAAKLAAEQGAVNVGSMAPQGFANTMEAGLANAGYTPSSLGMAFQNANAANGTGLMQNLGNYGKDLLGPANGMLSKAGNAAEKFQKANAVMGLLQPQQPPPQPMEPMQQQQPIPPMQMPYQQNPFGAGGNSLGMTEEEKRRRMMMMGLL